jgi:hypothetical protein
LYFLKYYMEKHLQSLNPIQHRLFSAGYQSLDRMLITSH